MSDGIQIQTVVSDNSVYYHQRQHRSLEHDSMCSSSDKSTSLNSNSNADPLGPGQGQQPPSGAAFQSSHHGTQHFHHQYQQQAAAALHQLRAVQDCENMNIGVPPTTAAASSGKLYPGLNNNNNSSNNNKNIGKKMSLSQQQKLEKIRNASNNNNGGGGGCDASAVGGVGTSGTLGGKSNGSNGVTNGTSASKSIISRLRQLTGRLSFNFDSRESKKLQLLAQKAATVEASTVEGESQPDKVGCATAATTTKKTRLLEKSKTVDVGGGGGGSVAICASGEGSMHYCCGGSGGVILNQPKSISPILMQHRNSDVIASMNTARNRAYSLDVPISRNCCRSLSGSTAGGGGSSCGGSHKSLTFSLNKSLNEEPIDTSSAGRPPLLDDTVTTQSAVKSGGSISETI